MAEKYANQRYAVPLLPILVVSDLWAIARRSIAYSCKLLLRR